MNTDDKWDLLGCVAYLLTSGASLIVGAVLALRWSAERSALVAVLIWLVCLTVTGMIGFLAMSAIITPFAYFAEKKAQRNSDASSSLQDSRRDDA